MGSGISLKDHQPQSDKPKHAKRVLLQASATGITDPRVLLGHACSKDLAELSDAVIKCSMQAERVCTKMYSQHRNDVQRASKLIDTTSNAAILKDRIAIAKNVAFNFTQAVLWGDQADFVSTIRHRTVIDSVQFKLNYQGALQISALNKRYSQLKHAVMTTQQQTAPSVNGRFPVCAHYWWKSKDLLAIILNYIPLKQLNQVSMVHKTWYAASKKVADVNLTKPIPGDRLLEAQRYYHSPVSIAVLSLYNVPPGTWFQFFSYASRNFTRLTTLTLKDCSSIVDDDLIPICERCVSLQTLTLASLAGLVRPKITSVSLEILSIEDCPWFEEIVGFIPSMTHVSLVRLNCMFGASFDRTCIVIGTIDEANSETVLKSFILKQCNGITDLVVKNCNVESIRILICGSLVNCTISAKKATIVQISQCCILHAVDINVPLLDRVVIQDMESLSKAAINCPIAEHITMQDIGSTTVAVLHQSTKNFKHLKSCRMVNIGAASRFPFGPDFQCFKILTTLFVSKCAFDDASLSILGQLEKLKQVEIWDCAALTCTMFEFSPSLKSFACHQCLNLFSFEIHASGMTNLLFSKCHVLRELNIQAAELSSVMLNLCEKIAVIHIDSQVLANLDFENIHKIENVSCNLPALQSVSISHTHEPPQPVMMQALFKSKMLSSISFNDLSGFFSFDAYRQHQKQWSTVRDLNLNNLALLDDACKFIEQMSGLICLKLRHCNHLNYMKLTGLAELNSLDIDECNNLADIIISAPKVQKIYVQNCQRLLSATLSGSLLASVTFRNTDSLFMLSSADGCPSLRTLFFSRAFDIHIVCRTFHSAPEIFVQICNQSHVVMMGELQMRRVGESND